MTQDFIIRPITGNEADHLLEKSSHLMAKLYPAESNHLVTRDELFANNSIFIGVFSKEICHGCVAAMLYRSSESYAEIKRLFIDDHMRGKSLAKRLMNAIEELIYQNGIELVRLETGIHQTSAIKLYESSDYHQIAPFGNYIEDPLSIFMEKNLEGL